MRMILTTRYYYSQLLNYTFYFADYCISWLQNRCSLIPELLYALNTVTSGIHARSLLRAT